ncbi:hypothetical protein OEB99_01575 [Actinotalea sp. M2MS4P-6]|uniref:hypothetical protein n=1 Tax=Actinotalea sp. M2MS4P-6 TaxID=2983762 RepID=UPI0021E45338|nr:hypothetical protein [Actinotalea sp. M2MS4P-6]MCV2392986.1 hypothetical protein [Actinotalea sp. M2MS4P-6]
MPAPLDLDDAAAHHLLVLAADVLTDDIEVLAFSRFPAARWESNADPGTSRGRPRPPGTLRLTRVSSLEGPYAIDRDVRAALGLPPAGVVGYLVRGPRERGDEAWPGSADRDGIARAFPAGLPVRDEGRVIVWLVAAARRLGGAVRVAGSGAVLVPDPAAAVDLTVWSDIWLDPDAGLSVARTAVPRARLDAEVPWEGPPQGTGIVAAYGAEDMDPIDRAVLHTAAEAYDMAVLESGVPRDAYGMLADLDHDGMLAVTVSGETEVPTVLADVPWAKRGAIAYRVSWEPESLEELGMEHPPVEHRVARGRAAPLVAALARALHGAVGGEITDMMGFVVDPADL